MWIALCHAVTRKESWQFKTIQYNEYDVFPASHLPQRNRFLLGFYTVFWGHWHLQGLVSPLLVPQPLVGCATSWYERKQEEIRGNDMRLRHQGNNEVSKANKDDSIYLFEKFVIHPKRTWRSKCRRCWCGLYEKDRHTNKRQHKNDNSNQNVGINIRKSD